MSTPTEPPVAHRGTIQAAVERARRASTTERVLGLAARPADGLPDTLVASTGDTIRVTSAASPLGFWTAVHEWDGNGWLVILTTATERELGEGTLALLARHHLSSPDTWDAVRSAFAATSIDRDLLDRHRAAELARGLLALDLHGGTWPPVRAGVLTRDHALSAVAAATGLPADQPDARAVLTWASSLTPHTDGPTGGLPGHAVRDLLEAVPALAAETLAWLAERTGPASAVVLHHLHDGPDAPLADLLPLGIAQAHLGTQRDPRLAAQADDARSRLRHRLPRPAPTRAALDALGEAARDTVLHALDSTDADVRNRALRALERAEEVLTDSGETARGIAAASDLLPAGLDACYRTLTAALTAGDARAVEDALTTVRSHRLAERDGRLTTALAAVRLDRWLRVPAPQDAGAVSLARAHLADTAWVDRALVDLRSGAEDPILAPALTELVSRVTERRARLDTAFAADLAHIARGDALPAPTADERPLLYLEDVLTRQTIPLAQAASGTSRPGVLVLLIDGMSTAASLTITESLLAEGSPWLEIAPATGPRRSAALALLPSLTRYSRTSFFTGAPTQGGQSEERSGLDDLARRAHLPGAPLFHKNALRGAEAGRPLPPEVAQAVADPARPLVGVVLNTIDDTLDKTNPGTITWTNRDVAHLRPLLAAAAAAGRTVVLTADHGHVLDRGADGSSAADPTSNRSRTGALPIAGPDQEVEVEGRRVLPDGHAVLAVDETLRYSGRHDGYHGGAALAEVVVPVITLQPRDAEVPEGWATALPERPAWWSRPTDAGAPAELAAAPADGGFDLAGLDADDDALSQGLGAAVVATDVYQQQKELVPAARIQDAVTAALIDALAAAPGHRLEHADLAPVLGVQPFRANGAVAAYRSLLNVEGYDVLRSEGTAVILDTALLRRQYLEESR